MAKGSRRNTKPRSVYAMKSLASYHGNLCVYLQDAEISQKLEQALENLKIEEKIDEKLSVDMNVLIALTASGERKYRRAVIDTLSENLLDATDLDTNEYYFEVDRKNVYSIKHLGDDELIEAPAAEPYYVHGYHNDDNLVNPKQLEKLFRHFKGLRWLMQKTGESHAVEDDTPVVKLMTENNRSLETSMKIKTQQRQDVGIPPLFTSPIEEVRVFHSEKVMGLQLRYLPLHELRRLEVSMTESYQSDAWKTCDSTNTLEGDLVAAFYNGRRVRGLVTEIRPGFAKVFLMDYGLIERFRYQKLWHLSKDLAFKLPRYGLRVQLLEEPDDIFDDCSIEVSLGREIDDCTFEGAIQKIVDDNPNEPLEDAPSKTEGSEQQPDDTDRAESASSSGADSEKSQALRPEPLPRELANYLGSTNEKFVAGNEERASPQAPRAADGASVSGESLNNLPSGSELAPEKKDDRSVDDREGRGASTEAEQAQDMPRGDSQEISVGLDENSSDDRSPAAGEDVAAIACTNVSTENPESSTQVEKSSPTNETAPAADDDKQTHALPDDSNDSEESPGVREPEASGDQNREEILEKTLSSRTSSKDSGDPELSAGVENRQLAEETAAVEDVSRRRDSESKVDAAGQSGDGSEVTMSSVDSELQISEENKTQESLPAESGRLDGENLDVSKTAEGAAEIPTEVAEIACPPHDVGEPTVEEHDRGGEPETDNQIETASVVPDEVIDSATSVSNEPIGVEDSLSASGARGDNVESVVQPQKVSEVPIEVSESSSPLPEGSADGIVTPVVESTPDGGENAEDQGPEKIQSGRDLMEEIRRGGLDTEEPTSPTTAAATKLETVYEKGQQDLGVVPALEKPPGIPIEQEMVKVEHPLAEVPDIVQAPARVDDSGRKNSAQVSNPIGNIDKSMRAEPHIFATVPQVSPQVSRSFAGPKVKNFEEEALLQNLTLPFTSSDPVLIVQVGESRRESSKPKKPKKQSKTDDKKAGRAERVANAPRIVDDAAVPESHIGSNVAPKKVDDSGILNQASAIASVKGDPIKTAAPNRVVVPDPTGRSIKTAPGTLRLQVNDRSAPGGASADTQDVEEYAKGQFDDAEVPPTFVVDQDNAVVDQTLETNGVVPVSEVENVPQGGFVNQTTENENSHPKSVDAVVPQAVGDQGGTRQSSTEITVTETTVCATPTSDDSSSQHSAADLHPGRNVVREDPQTTPRDIVAQVEEFPGGTREKNLNQAVAGTSLDRTSTDEDLNLKNGEEDSPKREDVLKETPKTSLDAASCSSVSPAEAVPNEVQDNRNVDDAVPGPSIITSTKDENARSKQSRGEHSQQDDAQEVRKDRIPRVQEPQNNVEKKSVDKAVAGTSGSGTCSRDRPGSKNSKTKPVARSDAREGAPARTARVRDFCEYPKLTFDTGKVLLATVTWIVNSRQLLMTHGACLASVEDQLGKSLGDPGVETSVRVGKIVLVEHEGGLKRACVAGIREQETGSLYYVYLLDYPQCLSTINLYVCPPAIAAMPRALLFVQLMGSQNTRPEWVGNECKLAVDRFEGSMISGLVLGTPDRKCSAVK